MNNTIEIFKNNKELSKYLINITNSKCKNDKKFELFISGGNTLNKYLCYLSQHKKYKNLKIFLTDERIAINKSNLLNSYQLQKKTGNLYKSEIFDYYEAKKEKFIFDTSRTSNLKRLKKINYAFIGIGIDGHYASIFNKSKLINKNSIFKIIKNKNEFFNRVSINETFFENISNLFIIVNSASKSKILNKIYNNKLVGNEPIIKLLRNRKENRRSFFLLVTKNSIGAINRL